MGVGGNRKTVSITVASGTGSANLPQSLERINQLIVTSNQSGQSFSMSLVNESSDTLWGPEDVVCPSNRIRPDLIPRGVVTVRITDAMPAAATVTVVIITEAK